MLDFDLMRVFVDAEGGGGWPLVVFLGGDAVRDEERRRVPGTLGVSRTAFVDDRDRGCLRVYTDGSEVAVCASSLVGAAWLLRLSGFPAEVLRFPAGRVEAWREDDLTWIRARPDWGRRFTAVELDSPTAVEAAPPPADGPRPTHLWAWADREAGLIRSRAVATGGDAAGDQAVGLAALALSGPIGRPITLLHDGSRIEARPGPEGTVEVGGRVAVLTATDYDSFRPAAT